MRPLRQISGTKRHQGHAWHSRFASSSCRSKNATGTTSLGRESSRRLRRRNGSPRPCPPCPLFPYQPPNGDILFRAAFCQRSKPLQRRRQPKRHLSNFWISNMKFAARIVSSIRRKLGPCKLTRGESRARRACLLWQACKGLPFCWFPSQSITLSCHGRLLAASMH